MDDTEIFNNFCREIKYDFQEEENFDNIKFTMKDNNINYDCSNIFYREFKKNDNPRRKLSKYKLSVKYFFNLF